MTAPDTDAGDLFAVDPAEQLDIDDGDPADTALEGGPDDDLTDVYDDPEGHS